MDTQTIRASHEIPEQKLVPWSTAFAVSWASLKRRLVRSLITMVGVILAIAFLGYMLITDNITGALVSVNDDHLKVILQRSGVDVFSVGETDTMMILLIVLSLFTCLVGIINAMLMAVTERVREIGTLKCLGAVDFFILQAYFIESSLQGVFGTLIGIVVGTLVAFGVAFFSYTTYVIPNLPVLQIGGSILLSFLIGSLLSVVASIAPAYWAARKQPVEALRVEE